jgi:hypothetical protein
MKAKKKKSKEENNNGGISVKMRNGGVMKTGGSGKASKRK